ncbi:MAG TPA: co-chaperone GroES [Roseiflexaceae bacterium]|jgi:chaperonin GroES|nr:co-chaperone GroES [Roseiflexaceae bacterium]
MGADFRIRPLADRVVVKPVDREEKTKGGIYLPDTASKERPMEGTVLAVGNGRTDDNGKTVPMNVKAGDKVLFAKYSGTEYKVDDVDYLILSEKDILGIIDE